jgi:hypothetical protein
MLTSICENKDCNKNDIEEMVLRVCKVQVNQAVITAHNVMLSSNNAKYPYTKTEIASMTLKL